MARYAMIDASGIVVNVIEWSGDTAEWQPPQDHTMVEDTNLEASPGGTWDGSTFTPPPSVEPGT